MKMNEFGPVLTYTWTSRDSTYNIKFTLETDGIVVEAPNGKSFDVMTQ
ncbi:hypothetical protein GO305_02936 [Ralstonia solanacearum]|nr:hypothetical protein [Ralstonia solanacearum]